MNLLHHLSTGRKFGWVTTILCVMMVGQSTSSVAADPLPRVTAGTTIDLPAKSELNQGRWNHVVLLAKPRISSGDKEKLSESIRESVSALTLTVLATIKRIDDGMYELTEVGVGYSVPIRGQQTVISYESASRLGANLGFIVNQMLSTNEGRLKDVLRIAHASNMLVFDAPAILFRGGQHRDYVVRHLCWIERTTGKAMTLVWLLSEVPGDSLRVVNEPFQMVAAGTIEDRRIHVDGSQFFLGIPNDRAFALEALPPGTPVSWPEDVSPLVSQRSYTPQELAELSVYLRKVITAANNSAKTE